MIKKALVLLPPGPEPADRTGPLDRLGGLTLIQRTLYSLRWAGIEEGIVFSPGERSEVERHMGQDPKLASFSWLSTGDTLKNVAEGITGTPGRGGDCIVHFPYWIVDRQVLKDLCAQEEALSETTLFEPPPSLPAAGGGIPPVALAPEASCCALIRACQEGTPLEQAIQGLSGVRPVRREQLPEEALIRVEKKAELPGAERQLFQRLIKPTESFLSQKFERKVSLAITRRLLHTRITPNQISVASILLGVFSTLLFLGQAQILHVLGGCLLLFSSIVDGCDGELARLRFQESRWGSWLDFLGDNLVHVSIFLCIGLGLYLRGEGTVYLVLGCLAALGNLGAASAVFLRVFLKSGDRVITFATPVRVEEMDRASGSLRRRIDFIDKLSNRDFFYLVLFCAAIGQLWFFMWVASLGVLFYFFNLIYLYYRMRNLPRVA